MRMLTSTSRRFTRRNDYRLGRTPAGVVRTKTRIQVARPEAARDHGKFEGIVVLEPRDHPGFPSAA